MCFIPIPPSPWEKKRKLPRKKVGLSMFVCVCNRLPYPSFSKNCRKKRWHSSLHENMTKIGLCCKLVSFVPAASTKKFEIWRPFVYLSPRKPRVDGFLLFWSKMLSTLPHSRPILLPSGSWSLKILCAKLYLNMPNSSLAYQSVIPNQGKCNIVWD